MTSQIGRSVLQNEYIPGDDQVGEQTATGAGGGHCRAPDDGRAAHGLAADG